jgi:hypothetical protein
MSKATFGRYAKFLTAIAGQALVYAQVTYGTGNRWVQLATAAAAALAVYAVPNKPVSPVSTPTQFVTTTGGVPPVVVTNEPPVP